MANDLSHNPYILDTTGGIFASNQPVWIRKIQFRGAAAGDTAVIGNGAGQEIARLCCAAAGQADEIDFNERPFLIHGLELTSIAANGVVHVYLG